MDTQSRPEVSHYTYRVAWSAEDAEFVATCLEFPSLSWLAGSQMEALEGLEALVTSVIDDLQDEGEEVPRPLAERSYSGRFNVRLGEALHRKLAMSAAQEDVSLNTYVVRKLEAAG